jgi:SAM-dependent methyltransferase
VKKRSRHEAEMNVMFIEHLKNLPIVPGMNSHINLWIGLVEACHGCRKKTGCQRRGGRNPQLPLFSPKRSPCYFCSRRHRPKGCLCIGEETLAQLGQTELTPLSQEEGSSHLLFERTNPQTDGGLRDIQCACGFAETAMNNDLVEGLQLVKIHQWDGSLLIKKSYREYSRYCLVLSRCGCYATEESFEKEENRMIQIKRAFHAVLDKQYPRPQGIIGHLAGELMVRQHEEETAWTVSVAGVQPTDNVLEIGFGAGKAIALLAEKTPGGSVAGIDLSATMVKRARARNRRAVRARRVTLQQGDAAHLPFAEQQFDKVISIHTFYFWSEPPVILAEIFRVLKPGGMCFITFTTGKAEETGLGGYQAIIEEQMLPDMRNIGWTSVSIKHGPIARHYKNVAVMGRK